MPLYENMLLMIRQGKASHSGLKLIFEENAVLWLPLDYFLC